MLSIIICTYNREKYIGNLLKSIFANTLDKQEYEIIIVDNNCTDNTREVCMNFQKCHKDVNFHYIVEKEQGLSFARNKGIHEAKGDIILYIDDDALVDEHYLQDYVSYFKNHQEVMAAGGPIEPMYETIEPTWMTKYTKALLTGWMNYGNKIKEYPIGKYPGGGNAAYHKKVFEQVGMFNTQLGRKGTNLFASEEKDIFDKMRRKGMKIVYLPAPILHHIIPQYKLEEPYFNKLTYQIGVSERKRTMSISLNKYIKRLLIEGIKWGGTLILQLRYILQMTPYKGWKLVLFRKNVTKGLLGI